MEVARKVYLRQFNPQNFLNRKTALSDNCWWQLYGKLAHVEGVNSYVVGERWQDELRTI